MSLVAERFEPLDLGPVPASRTSGDRRSGHPSRHSRLTALTHYGAHYDDAVQCHSKRRKLLDTVRRLGRHFECLITGSRDAR